MKILVASATALAAVVCSLAAAPVFAQPAAAIGKPLPSADLPDGTLSVRIIAGDPSQPVIGVDVSIAVNGAARTARTDSAGRALFPGIAPAATVQATVRGADGDVRSDSFPFPPSGGARVMLSTKPMTEGPAGGGGAGMMGGAGMPEPRNMSGQPRVEPADPAGMITVRLTYDDFTAPPPASQPVYLVAYGSDASIKVIATRSEADGRATFKDLDVTGNTAYFALAELPRGSGVDRMMSSPVLPTGQAGVRLILSADKRTSTGPAIDDITNFSEQTALPAGDVRVTLDYVPEKGSAARLIDAGSGKPVAVAQAVEPGPDAGSLTGALDPLADDTTAAGHLAIALVQGQGAAGAPASPAAVDGVTVRPVGAKTGAEVVAPGGQAAVDGVAVGAPVELVVRIGAERVVVGPLTMPAGHGAKVTVRLDWKQRSGLEVTFHGVPVDGVYYAETMMRNERYRSFPFQTIPGRGTQTAIAVIPRVLFKFSLAAAVEDAFLGVQGRFDVQNWAWAPYKAADDGILVPLPKDFSGAVVFDLKDDVSVDPAGFRILRPLPPGGLRFHGGFSLKAQDGSVHWDLELPRGAFESGIQVKEVPGMKVDLPGAARGQSMRDDDGVPYFVIANISIRPGERMVMAVNGLPTLPAWKTWGPRIVGVMVILLMGAGLLMAFSGRTVAPAVTAADKKATRARIDALYDQLVTLDRGEGDPARRAQIMTELESLLEPRA